MLKGVHDGLHIDRLPPCHGASCRIQLCNGRSIGRRFSGTARSLLACACVRKWQQSKPGSPNRGGGGGLGERWVRHQPECRNSTLLLQTYEVRTSREGKTCVIDKQCKAASPLPAVYGTIGACRWNSERLREPCEVAFRRLMKIDVSGLEYLSGWVDRVPGGCVN